MGLKAGLNGRKTGLWAGMVWELGRFRAGGWRDDRATFGGSGDTWPWYRGGGGPIGAPIWVQVEGKAVKEDEVFAYI